MFGQFSVKSHSNTIFVILNYKFTQTTFKLRDSITSKTMFSKIDRLPIAPVTADIKAKVYLGYLVPFLSFK